MDQFFNDRRARRGRAEPAALHRFAQRLVLHQFARAFHRGQQGRFAVARRRFGVFALHADFDGSGFFGPVLGPRERGQRLVVFLALHHLQPAALDHHPPAGLKGLLFDDGAPHRVFKAGRGVERRDETARDQFIDATFLFFQFPRHLSGWNDGKVVGYLRVVEDACVVAVDVIFPERPFGPVAEGSDIFLTVRPSGAAANVGRHQRLHDLSGHVRVILR